MKLSEMSADHVFDTLGVAGEELGAIFEDSAFTKKVEQMNAKAEDESTSAFGLRRVKDLFFLINSLSKTHRMGVYRIVAAFRKIPAEEVGTLSLPELWEQIRDSLNDELFLSFFPRLKPWVGTSLSAFLLKQDPAKPVSCDATSLRNTKRNKSAKF